MGGLPLVGMTRNDREPQTEPEATEDHGVQVRARRASSEKNGREHQEKRRKDKEHGRKDILIKEERDHRMHEGQEKEKGMEQECEMPKELEQACQVRKTENEQAPMVCLCFDVCC